MPAHFYCLGCDAYRSEEKMLQTDELGDRIRCLDCETVDEMTEREQKEKVA